MASRRHPEWLKVKIPGGKEFSKLKGLLKKSKIHTICEEAKCPNIADCFSRNTATFLLLGDTCTRNCTYCNVKSGNPQKFDINEAIKVARAVKQLKLNYVVLTSVTRDDLRDGGSMGFFNTMMEIRKMNPECKIEVLIPDFNGCESDLRKVVYAKPDVFGHNIEVVRRLFPKFRPEGNYERSVKILKVAKLHKPNMLTKSGLMLGLGETNRDIIDTMNDLRDSNVDIMTLGQYLQPSKKHSPIKKYYTPKEFDEFKKIGAELGFQHVESGPLVRSSYHAGDAPLFK
jgi:lipoyl synthase